MRTSYLQKIPFGRRYFRALAPLYPGAFEKFDLSPYDLVVSSTTSWAKGVIVRPGAIHVSYINTPSRYLFAYEHYVGGFGIGRLAKPLVSPLAAWDRRAAMRPTAFIANSRNVAERVRRYYGRDAFVLPCPVDVDRFREAPAATGRGDYFLVLSRLLPYKRIDLGIDAAALAGVKLLVAGEGPAARTLQQRARGTTTELLGFVPDAQIAPLVAGARAVIIPGEEDFGLVPLEAAAAGTPAIAFRGGGALETIVEGVTGVFFDEQSPVVLAEVLRAWNPALFNAQRLRAHAEQFAPARFIARLQTLVGEIVQHGEDGARRFVAASGSPASDTERAQT